MIKGSVIGYGAQGILHATLLKGTDGIELVAICDIIPERCEVARQDFENVQIYSNIDHMLDDTNIDLVVVVLPHNLHADVAIQCSKAGKHVIVEKPMCITVKEANDMILAAKENNRMLSVYHNRRWDADFLTLKRIVNDGLIGEVFRVEIWDGGYYQGNPFEWRRQKTKSGGLFYDWGVHYLDWLLQLVQYPIINVTGFCYDKVWTNISNEDHAEVTIRFANGVKATVIHSTITTINREYWTLWGSKGAITGGRNGITVSLPQGKQPIEIEPGLNLTGYYDNIVNHLTKGEKLIVKAEEARRVICVIEAMEKSFHSLQTETVPYEFSL